MVTPVENIFVQLKSKVKKKFLEGKEAETGRNGAREEFGLGIGRNGGMEEWRSRGMADRNNGDRKKWRTEWRSGGMADWRNGNLGWRNSFPEASVLEKRGRKEAGRNGGREEWSSEGMAELRNVRVEECRRDDIGLVGRLPGG